MSLPVNSCKVVALVPHPSDSAMLLCVNEPPEGPDALVLPTVELEPEPSIAQIVQELFETFATPVIPLRANALSWLENFDAASMVIELEPLDGNVPAGFCWRAVDESTIGSVSPDWASGAVAGWLHERTEGWSDRRPQWSRPGWLRQAGSWMCEQMEQSGFVDPHAPHVYHLWGVSVVLCAGSSSGTAYLKCSGEHFRHEATVTRALAQDSPLLLPDVVAVEPERGWLLMGDLAAPVLGDQPEASWGAGLDALVQLQQSWFGRTEELVGLGAERRPLTRLASWVEATVDDMDLLEPLTPGERATWSSAVPLMVESCQRLAETGPGDTLVHGDFHPWNVVAGSGKVRIFDWTDASVAHPFLDLVTYIMRGTDIEGRRSMMQRYLAGWSSHLADAELRHAARLALVVGALHQAHTYSKLIPTVMPDDLGQLRGGDAHWIRRALRYSEQGIESRY